MVADATRPQIRVLSAIARSTSWPPSPKDRREGDHAQGRTLPDFDSSGGEFFRSPSSRRAFQPIGKNVLIEDIKKGNHVVAPPTPQGEPIS
jgi:hypothetical protein